MTWPHDPPPKYATDYYTIKGTTGIQNRDIQFNSLKYALFGKSFQIKLCTAPGKCYRL